MSAPKRAHCVEVRLTREGEPFYQGEVESATRWVAFDSTGRAFYASTEEAARLWCDDYNARRN